jgi:hypothetical protein
LFVSTKRFALKEALTDSAADKYLTPMSRLLENEI